MGRVLVIDDSALVRRHLVALFEAAGHETAHARSSAEGLVRARHFRPEVVAASADLADLDPAELVAGLQRDGWCPVVVIGRGIEPRGDAARSLRAAGAVALIPTPDLPGVRRIDAVREAVLRSVNAAFGTAPHRPPPDTPARPATTPAAPRRPERFPVVLVGASTGGPRALQEVLSALPAGFPAAIVIAQHMPASFTASFAGRLAGHLALPVTEASEKMPLSGGQCYIARGNADCVLSSQRGRCAIGPVPASPEGKWRPSVDRLVDSALRVLPVDRLLGVLMTGIGDDGAQSLAALSARGAPVIAESEDSCVVFGMPARLIDLAPDALILHRREIAATLCRLVGVDAPGAVTSS